MGSSRVEQLRYVGYIAGTLSVFALLPQLVRILRTRNSNGVSSLTFLIIAVASGLWVWYGIANRCTAVAIQSFITGLLALTISILAFIYRPK